jgi:hypothetical protein
MPNNTSYPRYSTYESVGRPPSLLSQHYPRPAFKPEDNYYPGNALLEPHFRSDEQRSKFGAASFCGFLEDTVEVEHNLVIPAIASIRRLPYRLPIQAEQDLYRLATDEGFHAEQSQQFLTDIRFHFGLLREEESRVPLFLRRLELQRSVEPNPVYRDLITVLNGVVTETRISIELSKFASDKYLADSVRAVCHSHAEDESIHSSQFKALGQWLWAEFDEATRTAAASFLTASTIARNLPDVERIARNLYQSINLPLREAESLVYSIYTAEVLLDQLMLAARPTWSFLKQLGVDRYVSFPVALEEERARLGAEMAQRRAACSQ